MTSPGGEGSFPRGKNWDVHKFGGTCMATPERIDDMVQMIFEESRHQASENKFGAWGGSTPPLGARAT